MVEPSRRFPVKSQQFFDHPPESGADNVQPLPEQAVHIRAGVFQNAVIDRRGERHLAVLRRNFQMVKQR
ncbi:MAG: hypothetical protein VW709_18060, partial [Rickettsiales bacterium]